MNVKPSERQKEIIKASLELIAKKGIQGLTIKNLAKRIGLVESAIYRHYESKTEILISILDSIKDQTMPETTQHNVSVMIRLEQKLKNHFQAFKKFPALVSVIFAEDLFQNELLLAEKTKEIMQKSIADMTALVKVGQINGEIRKDVDSEQFAIMITGTIRMFVKKWKMSGYSFDLIQKGNKLIKSIKLLLKSK